MIPAAFDYARATSLDEAFALLAQHGDGAKIVAGGHSLIPMMKLRLATPAVLVDISRIPGLEGIAGSGATLTLGALTTHAAIAASEDARRMVPALYDAANAIGDAQVRNRGTIGGSCAHGDPASDYPAVLLALGATFTARTSGGTKTIQADDFFRGLFETALDEGAVLTQIALEAAPRSAYVKFAHPASHYAVVGAAAKLELEGSIVKAARIAVNGVGDSAFRAKSVEAALGGVDTKDANAVRAACVDAAAGIEARSDVFASGNYRAAMAGVYAARAVLAAAAR